MLNLDAAILIPRVLGLILAGHGAQKLLGWFGGHGIHGTAQWLETLRLNPARFWAVVAGLAELLGGLGLVLGLFTPIAAAAIFGVMLMAIVKVHWPNGLWVTQNGFEYPLVNAFIALFIGLVGPGRYALDTVLNIRYPMPLTFLIALVVSVIGVLLGLISGHPVLRTQQRPS